MKPNVTKHTMLLFILAGSISSCDKEDYSISHNPEKFQLTKILQYSSSTSRSPVRGVEYTYDNSGNMIRESFYDYQPTTFLWTYKEYEYSGNKVIKEKIYDGEVGNLRFSQYVDYTYEDDKLVKEEYCRVVDGSLLNSMNYEYDERGNLVRQYQYEPRYGITRDMKYVFDHRNRLILEENTIFGVANLKYIKYTYDDNDREIKKEYCYDNWDIHRWTEKMYNGTNKLPEIELHYGENEIQTQKILCLYDNQGNLIENHFYDWNGILTGNAMHYYDKWGNHTETKNNECTSFKRKYKGKLLIEVFHYLSLPTTESGKGGCTPESGVARYEYRKI